jgi:hypothetical protein
MKTIISLLSLLLIILSNTAQGQILKKLQQKAEQAVEKAVERKVDQELEKAANRMVENSWNALFGSMEGGANGTGTFPFTMGTNVTTQDEYTFDVMTRMRIEGTDANGKASDPMVMEMYFAENAKYTGTKIKNEDLKQEQGDLFIIYDFANGAMLMLMEAEEGKFSFAYGFTDAESYMNEAAEESDVDWEEVQEWKGFKKIGTKTINGYACEGYLTEDEASSTEVWVTRDEAFGMGKLMGANSNTKQLKGKFPADYPYGIMVQTIYEDKNSKESMTMTLEELKKNIDARYEMADYPSMSFGDSGKK